MKNQRKIFNAMKALIIMFLMLAGGMTMSQEPIFNDYNNSLLYVNPAFAGVNRCPRLSLSYQNQWYNSDNGFNSFLATFDQRVERLRGGLGLMILHDQSIKYKSDLLKIGGVYSYRININRNMVLQAGLAANFTRRKFDQRSLHFRFDPNFLVQTDNERISERNYLDLSGALLFYTKWAYLGLTADHFNRPRDCVDCPGNTRLPVSITSIGALQLELGAKIEMQPSVIYRWQPSRFFIDSTGLQAIDRLHLLSAGLDFSYGNVALGLGFRYFTGYNIGFSGRIGYKHEIGTLAYTYTATPYLTQNAEPPKQTAAHAGTHTISLLLNFECRPKKRKFRAISCPSFGGSSGISFGRYKWSNAGYSPIPQVISSDVAYTEFNTEAYDKITDNPFLKPLDNPLSTFSIDVDNASYSNTRRFLNYGQLPEKDAVRIEEFLNYFTYDYPEPKDGYPLSISTEISDCPWKPGHKLVHIGLQGKHIPSEILPPNNLVFLIDVSGSMSASNKLPLLKSSFKMLVNQLRAQDRVAIVVYAGAAGLVLPPTSGSEKSRIMKAIDKLSAGGSTAGGEGIKLAYKLAAKNFIENGNNRVILATDGDFNIGQSSDAAMERLIEEKRKSGVFLTVLGFGMGNYKDSKMEKLAGNGNGNYGYIDNIQEARKMLVTEFTGNMYVVAKDVKLQIEFNPTRVQAYRLIGYENRLLNKEDFNDDKKDAGELGAGQTVTALYEIIPIKIKSTVTDSLPAVDPLKYQVTHIIREAVKTKELMTIKLRYKDPADSTSKLIIHPVIDREKKLQRTSDNYRFAAAVAQFGLLLRDSEHKGNAGYDSVISLATEARGEDTEGYRGEFIKLVKVAREIK